MKSIYFILFFSLLLFSCADSEDSTLSGTTEKVYNWTVSPDKISGSLNFFPLAMDPLMKQVKDIDFIPDDTRVAIVQLGNTIRVYPYIYISKFEAVNEKEGNIEYAITYCPKTNSALIMDRKFKSDNFTIRASGYLFQDNQVLVDEKSDTFWSQMLIKCIKGKYAGEHINTFNYVETKWSTVKEFFPNAMVFTNTSVASKNSNSNTKKDNLVKGSLTYGIIDLKFKQTKRAHLFHFDDSAENIKLNTVRISGEEVIVIKSKEKHFITSYINDTNVYFKAVQDAFPAVMEDSNSNKWNVFGIAISGPRKGEQLKSLPSFFALDWAWENFYDDIVFSEQ